MVHHRELAASTGKLLVPPPLMRSWMHLFVKGLPLSPESVTAPRAVPLATGHELDRAVHSSMRFVSDATPAAQEVIISELFEDYLNIDGEWANVIEVPVEPDDEIAPPLTSESAVSGGQGDKKKRPGSSKGKKEDKGREKKRSKKPEDEDRKGAKDKEEVGPEEQSESAVVIAKENRLFGAVVAKIIDVASGKEEPPDLPEIPRFPIGICLIGKPFSGRSTQAQLLAAKHHLTVFTTDELVKEALESADSADGAISQPSKISAARKSSKKTVQLGAPGGGPLTTQQSLGQQIKKIVAKGKLVTDELYVALVVDAIKRQPQIEGGLLQGGVNGLTRPQSAHSRPGEDRSSLDVSVAATRPETGMGDASTARTGPDEMRSGGWVLVGFPETAAQAMLLEKELTGFEVPKTKKPGAPKVTKKKKEQRPSRLARPDSPEPRTEPFPSGITLVFRLETSNEVLFRRALGRRLDPVTGKHYHLDFNPPDMDTPLKERLVELPDAADVRAKLPSQLILYDQNEPALTEWFSLFNTQKVVDCAPSIQDVFAALYGFVANEMKAQETRESEQLAEEKRRADAADLESRGQSVPLLDAQSGIAPGNADSKSLKSNADSIKSLSGSSSTALNTQRTNATFNEDEEDEDEKVAQDLTPVNVMDFKNLNGFLDVELAKVLADRWIKLETRFTEQLRGRLHAIAQERLASLSHFAVLRKNFFRFLRRPDNKMELVNAFVADYNRLHPDLRMDVQSKEEMHQRADELGDKLWDITDRRREESEDQLQQIQNDGWVDNQSAALVTLYCCLLQLEIDRYLGSICIAQDYFSALKHQVIYEEVEPRAVALPFLSKDGPSSKKRKPKEGKKKTEKKGKGNKEEAFDALEVLEETKAAMLDMMLLPEEAVEQTNSSDSKKLGSAVERGSKVREKKRERRKEVPKAKIGNKKSDEKEAPVIKSIFDRRVDVALCDAQLKHVVATENKILEGRIARIMRNCAMEVAQLRNYADNELYPRFEQWLQLRVQGENSSIDTLLFLIKTAVEREEPLYHRLRLEGADVFIDKDILASPVPELPLTGPFSAMSDPHMANRFSAAQLDLLSSQCRRYASEALIAPQQLCDLLINFNGQLQRGFTPDVLPMRWTKFSRDEFTQLIAAFHASGADLLAWRSFIAALALPPPLSSPSLGQLKQVLSALEALDGDGDGKVQLDEFLKCDLWFEPRVLDAPANRVRSGPPAMGQPHAARTTEDPNKELAPLLEASRKLKQVLFNVVCEEAPEPFQEIARPKHKEVEHGEDEDEEEDEEEAPAKTASRQSVITTGKVSGRSALPPGAMETTEKDKDSSTRMGVEVKTQRSIYPAAFCCLFCFDDEEMTGAQKVKALLDAARESERNPSPKPQHHQLIQMAEQGMLNFARKDVNALVSPM